MEFKRNMYIKVHDKVGIFFSSQIVLTKITGIEAVILLRIWDCGLKSKTIRNQQPEINKIGT